MSTNLAMFPASIWDGSSPTRTADPNRDKGPDFEDWDQITAEMKAVQEELTSNLDGSNVKTVAPSDVVGGIPLIFIFTIPDTAGDYDIVMTHKVRVLDVMAIKTVANGGAGDTVTLKNGTTAISNAMSLNINDTLIARATSLDDAQFTVLAAGTLRVTAAKVTNCASTVQVTVVRVP